MNNQYTYQEQERAAYISGNIVLADAIFDAMKFEIANDDCGPLDLESPIDAQIDELIEKAVEKQCPNYEEYKQFFDDCVEALNARWPAAEVTDYNLQQVIFDAITKGDAE